MAARNCHLRQIEFNPVHLKVAVYIGEEGQTAALSSTLVLDSEHWQADMQALAAALQDYVAGEHSSRG